jgi:hypothetical protein
MKEINNSDNLSFFPFMFFMIGAIVQLFATSEDNFFASTLILMIGVEVYFLFYIWFMYELRRFGL